MSTIPTLFEQAQLAESAYANFMIRNLDYPVLGGDLTKLYFCCVSKTDCDEVSVTGSKSR